MNEVIVDFLTTLNPGAFAAAIAFGASVGASYGWRMPSAEGRRDATTLFWVVLGFFVVRAMSNLLTGSPLGAGRTLGGILLWLVCCWGILVGRRIRLRLEAWRQARELRRARKRVDE